MQAGPLSTNRAPATIISGPGPAVRKDGRVRVKGSTRLVAPSPVATMASCGCSVVTHLVLAAHPVRTRAGRRIRHPRALLPDGPDDVPLAVSMKRIVP